MSAYDSAVQEPAPRKGVNFAKRQHFVPEMMQKRFVGQDGRLWFYDRRRKDGIGSTRPGNLFLEGHLYTLENDEGERFGAIETFLARLEGATDPILEQIVERARSGLTPYAER